MALNILLSSYRLKNLPLYLPELMVVAEMAIEMEENKLSKKPG